MATRVWNQVPGAAYWGTLPPQVSTTSVGVQPLERSRAFSSPTSPADAVKSNLPMSRSRNISLNFYDFAANELQDEKELQLWIKEEPNRGAIRVYQPGSTFSELTKCDTETFAEVIMSKCVTNNLYVYYAGHSSEPLGFSHRPLEIQNKFLRSLGYEDPERIQFEGTREDLVYMFKFVAGKEENKADERVQLTCIVKFKESSPFSFWSKRFCVLCSCQLHVFSSSTPKGKPSLSLDLAGGNVTEYETKKHMYCVQIVSSKKTVFLSFDSRYDQSVWLKRAAKVVTKHPLEADLSRCSLNCLPKYLFLNKNLAALNLSHNFMLERVEDATVSPQPEGWINDIYRFANLKILSLSDNNLVHFPVPVCNIVTLSELDLSCNRIRVIPQDIQKLKKLTTLLLHSNLISTLPYHLNNLQRLTTLVIAFNRFKSIPHIVKELESLRILIAAGNSISSIPEDINRIQTLQILDLRLNQITTTLPSTLPELLIFFSLNIRGNEVTELDMRRAKNLHVVNCSDNLIRTLSLHKGRVSMINARNNCISKLTVASTSLSLTSLDLSKNELSTLPDSLCKLVNLEKLMLSHNKLSSLPKNIMIKLQKLRVLHVSNNNIVSFPVIDYCVIESIDIHSNKLHFLPENLFTHCQRLQQLNVSNNPITAIPSPVKKQGHSGHTQKPHPLVELRACNCSLTGDSIGAIIHLKKLKVLHLAYNSITELPPEIFMSLSELEYFNISSNKLDSIKAPPHSCPRLVCLIIHSNKLKEFPVFPLMPSVETLDLSCNELQTMPQLLKFRRLKTLNLSHNTDIAIDPKDLEHLRFLQYFGLEGTGSVGIEVKKVLGDCVEIESKSFHKLWSCGSASTRGTNLNKTGDNAMQQIKLPSLNEKRETDGLFVMIDGGKSSDASARIKKKMAAIVHSELLACEERRDKDKPLLYLEHSFLTMHRRLGSLGLKYGASMILTHLKQDTTGGGYTLNVANTGLGDAILCHGSQVTPLTVAHNPATNRDEVRRIVKEKGFISEDDRVNGICGVSRLLGCYYLHPQVIPLPNTKSIQSVPTNSSYIIIASHGLLKFLTHKEILKMTSVSLDPNLFARELADMAIGCGCPLDVSVIVVKLNMDNARVGLEDEGARPKRISTASGDHDIIFGEGVANESVIDEEEEEVTNIDEIMEEAFQEDENIFPEASNSALESEGLRSISPDQLDALISDQSEHPQVQPLEMPIVQADSNSSNDSLILHGSLAELGNLEEEEDEDEEDETRFLSRDVELLSKGPLQAEDKGKEDKMADRRTSTTSGHKQEYNVSGENNIFNMTEEMADLLPLEEDYKPKTFPRKASRSNVHPKSIDFNAFDQTQSVPAVYNSSNEELNNDKEDDDDDDPEYSIEALKKRRRSAPNPAIQKFNKAISLIDDKTAVRGAFDRAKVERKKSFVESSYSRLSRHIVSSDTDIRL